MMPLSTCASAPRAERYMRGKAITAAARTVASQLKAICNPKLSIKKRPTRRLLPKIISRKKPATVGGSTMGSVKTPSMKILALSVGKRSTHHAATTPKTKTMAMVAEAVSRLIHSGEKSIAVLSAIAALFIGMVTALALAAAVKGVLMCVHTPHPCPWQGECRALTQVVRFRALPPPLFCCRAGSR